MSIARRVELRVVAIGGALPEDLTNRLLSATYTDNEEDAADDFQLSYDNAVNSGNSQWVEVKTTIAPPETGKLVQREIAPTETIDYIVQRGDTLSGIAAKYLGSASKYTQIVQENGIKNPDLIYPGQVFKITTGGQVTATRRPPHGGRGLKSLVPARHSLFCVPLAVPRVCGRLRAGTCGVAVPDIDPQRPIRPQNAPHFPEYQHKVFYVLFRRFLHPYLPRRSVVPQVVIGRGSDAGIDTL